MAGEQGNRLVVEREEVVGVDYSAQGLTGLVGIGACFERCRFEGLRFQDVALGSGMELSQYVECSFDGAVLTGTAGYSQFVGCTFREAEIRDLTANYLEIVDCVFTGRIRSTTFWGAPPPGSAEGFASDLAFLAKQGRTEPPGYRALALRESNEFHGNDFSEADLIGVAFRYGVDLSRQRLPTASDYLYLPDAETALHRALSLLADQPADDLHARVERSLRRMLDREVGNGQRQLLFREADYKSRGVLKPHARLMFELLRKAAGAGA
ncbi:hypothetical protein DER29_0414 [Micromonospora sp. M71_S20]|uniref:hypothetical protein n=1 Tax=Micromonospora sp. M71_S20 TaxID=592872 RepID=UPI000EB2A4D0|nr:hypothetical protein [Micromonospora sp. M71_S20]RLK22579.1 hypothetical protein DER29_0414 [Micromonospora sp. M71_S20]